MTSADQYYNADHRRTQLAPRPCRVSRSRTAYSVSVCIMHVSMYVIVSVPDAIQLQSHSMFITTPQSTPVISMFRLDIITQLSFTADYVVHAEYKHQGETNAWCRRKLSIK